MTTPPKMPTGPKMQAIGQRDRWEVLTVNCVGVHVHLLDQQKAIFGESIKADNLIDNNSQHCLGLKNEMQNNTLKLIFFIPRMITIIFLNNAIKKVECSGILNPFSDIN